MGEALACDGDDALKQRLVLHHGFVDSKGCSHVLQDGAHADWQCRWCGYLTTDDCVDELLLASLRVFHLEWHHLDALVGFCLFGHEAYGIGLVVFDSDECLVYADGLHEQGDTHEYLVGMFEHEAVVGSEVGLTLHGVDDDPLGLAAWRWRQLYVARETCSTHAHDACCLHLIYNIFRSEFRTVGQCDEVGASVDGRFPLVAFHGDVDCRLLVSAGIDYGVNFQHCARY